VASQQGLDNVVGSAKARLEHSDIPIPRERRERIARPPGPGTARALRNFLSPTRAPRFLARLERDYPDITHMR